MNKLTDEKLISLSFGAAFIDDVSLSGVESLSEKFRNGDSWLRENAARRSEGFGWINLPSERVDEIRALSRWLATRDSIVQIGIGGSALGNLMLNNALLPPYWNELPEKTRNAPRFFMSDNVDPVDNRAIWNLLNPDSTAFIVVSKSGATAETMANFLFFWERLRDKIGESAARERVIVITDKDKGILRPFVDEIGCKSLVLPEDVGGRFSVLTSVGLLSGWALGMDCDSILKGAGAMDKQIASAGEVLNNPAWIMSGLSFLHSKKSRNMSVLMPYVDCLERFCEWYAQLWGESVGKNGKGTTPIRALGAIDQHSQVQLYTEGPDDKLFTIITVGNYSTDITIPVAPQKSLEKLSYLFGKSMNNLRNSEALSTAAALVKAKRPVLLLEIPKLDAYRLGALIQYYEYVTGMMGWLLEIDPFNQPGVEQGKNYTYGLMGRAGYENQADEVNELCAIISKNVTEI
ncbi:MAG: glucose-6-phosphate isomerase [Synergistaceae bacterium]|nr:glucose-6-phosphate isomerase [Synergistaceae bacterium]